MTANHDPEGQSRIQVQMLWQKDETTEWIRVLQPDAGSGEVNGNNRGFYVIPEIGDQVIVGFRYNDPNRPFVMGSIYHSQNTDSAIQANNHLKSLSTRSGHVIEFDDSKGSQGITITDQNNNVIHIDTQSNNITISALETMTFNSKNMKINVQENMDISVGKNKKEFVTENFDLQVKNMKTTVAENADQVTGKKAQHIAGEMTMHTNEGKILIDGTGKITIQSKDRIDYGE
ncbi:phage baseplate assembly protein V [Pedobacter sp. NJ-S-72]